MMNKTTDFGKVTAVIASPTTFVLKDGHQAVWIRDKMRHADPAVGKARTCTMDWWNDYYAKDVIRIIDTSVNPPVVTERPFECEWCAGLGDTPCGAGDRHWMCSRKPHHDGDHVACLAVTATEPQAHALHRWPQEPAVSAEPKVEPWMEELATKFDESPAAGGRHDKLVKLIARAYAERKK